MNDNTGFGVHPRTARVTAAAWIACPLALISCACAALLEPSSPSQPQAAAVADAPVSAGSPGAAGVGDELFPDAGNGGYDVESYDIALALDHTDGPIDASATIQAKSTQALSRFDLDLHALDVHAVEVDGAAAKFAREEDELVVTPRKPIAAGASFTVRVTYGGIPEGVVEPSIPFEIKMGWIAKNGEVYVLSEPTGAKSFFPCNDHPRDKALYTIRVTVPRPLMVVSNGTLAQTIDGGDKRTFVYESRDPIASYLVTIAIAEFEEAQVDGPDGLTIHDYFAPKTRDKSRESFDKSGTIIRFLSDTFGPYPFESCGNIVASIAIPGALETQTLPTYGAGATSESIICHEQAHQWFGDSVSVESWSDIWLNEGFAEYASWMYLESQKGREAFEKHVVGMYGVYRAREPRAAKKPSDGSASSAPKPRHFEPPPGKPTIASMFGAGVYVRGPLALHALRTEVGDAAFLALMRAWCAEHKNANASIADFLQHVEHSTTKAARTTVEHWIYDEEMPHVAAWDAELVKQKAERDARRKERDEQRAKDKEKRKEKDAEKEKSKDEAQEKKAGSDEPPK